MITFHPAARRNAEGSYVPMVTLRADRGRMVGSKLAQNGNTFETSAEALEHATNAEVPELVRASYPLPVAA